mgnify:CR=1 FL=1
MYPGICENLRTDHSDLIALYREARALPGMLFSVANGSSFYRKSSYMLEREGQVDVIRRELPPPSVIVVGEPTNMDAVNGHKGIATFHVTVTGREAHSSQPHLGVSAVMAAARLMNLLIDLSERLERVYTLMESEISVLQVERKIRSRVKRQMEKTQREYYLNEQMKAIQKELGDSEEGRDDLAGYGDGASEELIGSLIGDVVARDSLDSGHDEMRDRAGGDVAATVLGRPYTRLLARGTQGEVPSEPCPLLDCVRHTRLGLSGYRFSLPDHRQSSNNQESSCAVGVRSGIQPGTKMVSIPSSCHNSITLGLSSTANSIS